MIERKTLSKSSNVENNVLVIQNTVEERLTKRNVMTELERAEVHKQQAIERSQDVKRDYDEIVSRIEMYEEALTQFVDDEIIVIEDPLKKK